ncbi:MAG: MBL fold metallo-hydrolase [Muribaculaceae bacterium]|nr:MBL fold metallo-hydrolase [Muribaculaceae bacterium]
MKISRFEVNPFAENTYILWNETTCHAIVIDPGMMKPTEHEAINAFLTAHSLKVINVLLTHIHIDHVAGAMQLASENNCEICASQKDELLNAELQLQAMRFGLRINAESLVINHYLAEGDTIMLDGEEIKVIETPGHSPGGLSFYAPQSGAVFVGDTLFEGSIGRTDLLGGNLDTLISSIKTKLFALPDDTMVIPGHGPTTTIGEEKQYNYYLD